MRRKVIPPYNGVANNTTFIGTPNGYCPPGSMLNARTYTPDKDRPTIGQRPGIRNLFPNLLAGNPVQGLGVVSRASVVTGYVLGQCDMIGEDWTTREANGLDGHLWFLDGQRGMYETAYYDAQALDGAASPVSAAGCATTPDGTLVAYFMVYDDGSGNTIARIRVLRVDDATEVWTAKIAETGVNRFVNQIVMTNTHTFVCTNDELKVYNTQTGALRLTTNINGWALEVVSCCVSADGQFLYVAFDGNNTGKVLASGVVVTGGKNARHWRSGIIKYQINPITSLGVIGQVTFGTQLTSPSTYYEADHGYWRFSEQVPWKPWGTETRAIAAHPDGGIVLGHTNQGRGPNASFPPAGNPYVTLTKINANGAILWQTDTDSFATPEIGDLGFQNDIPTAAGDFPSVVCMAIGSNGTVYAAGRINTTEAWGVNVFAIRGTDGVRLWNQDLGGTILEPCLAIDPTDDNPVLCGVRNTAWSGSGGAQAHLWKVRAVDGLVIQSQDLNTAATGLGVAVTTEGKIIYATTKV